MKKRNRGKGGFGVFPLFLSIISNPAVRLDIALLSGLLMNIFYIAVNLLPAVRYKSAWSFAVTVYYSVLVLMRLSLLASHRLIGSVGDDAARLYTACRRVGKFLLLLDTAIAIIMIYTVIEGRVIDYPTYILVGFGVFTVYSLASSVIGIFRSLRQKTPHVLAARNLTLAAALLSVFNLQYTLLVTIGVKRELLILINAVGGALIILLITGMAIRLITVSSRRIREIRSS